MNYQSMDKDQLLSEINSLQDQIAELKKDKFHRDFLTSIIEHLPIPMAILAINEQGGENSYVYEFANEAVAKLNGKLVSQHLGHTLEEVLGNHEVVAGIKANFKSVIESGETSKRKIDIPIDGQMRRLIEYHFPISQQGKVLAVGATLIDITELSDALKDAQQANQAKSDFLSQMSHELRTPMNAIMGFAQLLRNQGKRGAFNEKHQGSIGHILNSGKHLLGIIDDILDLSGIEAGRLNLEIEPVSLAKVLNETRQIMDGIASKNDIAILVQDSFQFQKIIQADERRMIQVLLNLVSNAVKYNRVGGTVLLFCQAIEGNKLRISVQDSGQGISAHQQSNLFQPFDRLGRNNGPVAGTGIGLLISKKIIEAMNGAIGFKSEEGKGSCFWVDIPLADSSDNEAMQGQSNPAPNKATKTLLYVEDNPSDIQLMELILERELPDFRLILAPSAELGLEQALNHTPDVIILDIRLPSMSGLELLKKLKSLNFSNHDKIIALTAEATRSDKKLGLEAGFHAYLTKPMDIENLVSTINNLTL